MDLRCGPAHRHSHLKVRAHFDVPAPTQIDSQPRPQMSWPEFDLTNNLRSS